MATVTDLPDDLVREIFSRVPLTSLRAVRSTCKKWNAISKYDILGKKAAAKNQFLEFMVTDSRVCSLRLDLQGIRSEEDLIDLSIKQISIPNKVDQVEISQVYHCDGLLLCIAKDNSSVMVWNPYLGQTKLIQPRKKLHRYDKFALGYDNNRNHKILRFLYEGSPRNVIIDVYDFSSDSWRRVFEGNTYFFGRKGPRLPMLFKPPSRRFEYLTLSCVRNEKLAVLYSHLNRFGTIEICISTKIDPSAVSWTTFLRIDMTLINGLPDNFFVHSYATSFFFDEEKKVAVLFGTNRYRGRETCQYYQRACIVGDSGYFKAVNIELVFNSQLQSCQLVSSSYVPSLVQLQD
ncbi:F-box protein [Arabidopsis thaliana]